jgi:hypothetical protein
MVKQNKNNKNSEVFTVKTVTLGLSLGKKCFSDTFSPPSPLFFTVNKNTKQQKNYPEKL